MAFYTHYYLLIFLPVHFIFLLMDRKRDNAILMRVIKAQFFALVLFSPVIGEMLRLRENIPASLAWLSKPGIESIWQTMNMFMIGQHMFYVPCYESGSMCRTELSGLVRWFGHSYQRVVSE